MPASHDPALKMRDCELGSCEHFLSKGQPAPHRSLNPLIQSVHPEFREFETLHYGDEEFKEIRVMLTNYRNMKTIGINQSFRVNPVHFIPTIGC